MKESAGVISDHERQATPSGPTLFNSPMPF